MYWEGFVLSGHWETSFMFWRFFFPKGNAFYMWFTFIYISKADTPLHSDRALRNDIFFQVPVRKCVDAHATGREECGNFMLCNFVKSCCVCVCAGFHDWNVNISPCMCAEENLGKRQDIKEDEDRLKVSMPWSFVPPFVLGHFFYSKLNKSCVKIITNCVLFFFLSLNADREFHHPDVTHRGKRTPTYFFYRLICTPALRTGSNVMKPMSKCLFLTRIAAPMFCLCRGAHAVLDK